jgi:hypothetical protein
MRARIFVWRAPNLFVVFRCVRCPRDVWIRWPEAWRLCDRCGEMALASFGAFG